MFIYAINNLKKCQVCVIIFCRIKYNDLRTFSNLKVAKKAFIVAKFIYFWFKVRNYSELISMAVLWFTTNDKLYNTGLTKAFNLV